MKILMIAPEPFFEPRGTPFSEYYRIKALSSLGHEIDLITYPIGEDVEIKGLKIIRCLRPFFIKKVKTGPSGAKVFLDFFLFFKVFGRILTKRYDYIHTHEEANIMGACFSTIFRTPHLYDMHSSLVQQMNNFKFTKSKLIVWFFKTIEKISLKNAKSIIVICPSLFKYASTITEASKLTTIENFMDETPEKLNKERLETLKKSLNIKDKKVIVYAGTLETYQGIPMLIESMKYLDESFLLVLIGGDPPQVEKLKSSLNSDKDNIILLGRKSPEEIPYYLSIADILVSPRILGTNIPLKVYSYLKSGIPLVATNLYTHTQTLTKDISVLVEPDSKAFAEGIKIATSKEGMDIAKNAKEYCNKNYNEQKYIDLVNIAINKTIEE
jgi:glycosyltransferase involved in cell wall biosynthesis